MAKKAKRDDYQLCEKFAKNIFSNTAIAKLKEEKYVGIKLKLKESIKQINFIIQSI